ncbi:hypothetical protein H5410_045726 [Solanum commersonii]|uniref:Uncharacterized protein n=1 Tax=Solanum commersonii TaxID=4109 RepID=A0A9J5XDK9_SOLCO|nr:hypothetical protein H5410_045726 [Solanum commersonii]
MNFVFQLRQDVGMAKIILKCIELTIMAVVVARDVQGYSRQEEYEPTEEERWIEPRAQETYVRTPFKLIFFSFPCIYYILIRRVLCLNYRIGQTIYTRRKQESLEKESLVKRLEVHLRLSRKGVSRRRSLGIVVHHPQALMAGIKRQYLQWKKRKKKRGGYCSAKEVENKRYASL